ncbi:excinuclease ABC subunit UvrC [Aminirod propionatiphilus]|uniref:Excinuclease ABC subunit UvrC n=1 Tax=Aminirod propionatiphilus TaxID=3415223 RepID=A0ACD1DZE4_9BACT|nr:excinuclease ABC subunit UvrC [Synergistota bacterium]
MTHPLQEKVRKLPLRPGVYLFHDGEGTVLYVGKAKSLRKRVASYFRHEGFASPRLRKLVESARDLSYIRTESEAEALIVESRLIKKYQPFFNVELKMGERYPFLKITDEPFPRLEITRHRSDDGGRYVGPFTRVGDLRRLLRLIERHFPLRTCKTDLSGPRQERPCVRHALGRCGGACAGLTSEAEYGERVADVLLLLQGNAADLVERLRLRMDRAASGLAFEEAARLRDTIRSLWRLSRQRLSSTLSHDLDRETWTLLLRLQELLGLPTIPWRIDGFDISHFSGKEMYGVAVVFEQGLPNPSLYRRFAVKSVEGVDDFRALEEVVGRRYRRCLEGEEPLPQLVLIDGGPLQLEFAAGALAALGLEELPIVSLAKREEQLFLPGRKEPLELPLSDPALQLLQRVRDESHRFAVASHRRGRDSRLRRSVLEDVPGVGKKRAALLLIHFGSVQKIASLEPDELTLLPGIGPETARRIVETLREEKV